ncbi:MAG TPA: molybdenum cofactor guanylyltransferase [Candidatus Eremiobacteraceae bacterium]|nr:molybdenum cofactor guanylyltransferase [Candidatus Eremiobacteraceae bacterium]
MSETTKVCGYVLAGGASSRFGTDKALAEFAGQTMLMRTAKLLLEVAPLVRIVSSINKLREETFDTVPDLWPGEGPLGGILTGLLNAREGSGDDDVALIVSCDMPFLTPEWLRFLAHRASESHAEVVVPKSAQGWEPLCACWRVSTIEIIKPLFEAGTRKVTDALNALHVEVLDEKDWKRFDTNGRLFWNMNTQTDYEQALRVLSAEKP